MKYYIIILIILAPMIAISYTNEVRLSSELNKMNPNNDIIYTTALDNTKGKSVILKCDLTEKRCLTLNTKINLAGISSSSNSIAVTSHALYIGARLAEEKGYGSVYKCNLNGENCQTIVPYNKPIGYGTSVAVSNTNLYIGSVDYSKEEPTGILMKCSLNGDSCVEIFDNLSPILMPTEFTASMTYANEKLYIAAPTDNLIFECVDSNAIASCKYSGLSPHKDNIGTSLSVSKEAMYFGANNSNNYDGSIIKCSHIRDCEKISSPIENINHAGFGSSILATNKSLYVSANNTEDTGVIYKCTLEVTNCIIQLDPNELGLKNIKKFGRTLVSAH